MFRRFAYVQLLRATLVFVRTTSVFVAEAPSFSVLYYETTDDFHLGGAPWLFEPFTENKQHTKQKQTTWWIT